MHQLHLNSEFVIQVLGHMLSAVHRAVTAACTPEAYHEVGETAFYVPCHRSIHEVVAMAEEIGYFPIVFKKLL